MSVYVHGGAGLAVPQAAGHRADVDALLDQQRGACVAQAVKGHLAQAETIKQPFQAI